jgi:MinD-like ATPase involved in chromosome partitioning or flagellar assembly
VNAGSPQGAGGTICTFYSYKGGVGRTLALANVAVLLAQWGYRVLCIDWDLEAPGLHLYYEGADGLKPTPGVVELVEGLREGGPVRWREHTVAVELPGTGDRLRMMPAGKLDDDYFGRMQALDWPELYEERNLGEVLEALRFEWTQEFDFVLIDSRTGVTDIGGICTVQLPDVVAFLFTPNSQSVKGSLEIIERAEAQREKLPIDRSRLLALPVVTRWEANVELELSRTWLTMLALALEPSFSSWAHKSLPQGALLNHARLPYVPRWSFGEELPVVKEGTADQLSLGYALETLAALIANRLEHTDLLVANRQSYVDAAKFAKVTDSDRYALDVQVLAQGDDTEFARELAGLLQERFWRVAFEPTGDPGEEVDGAPAPTARNLVVVLGEQPSRWLDRRVREFLQKILVEEEDWRLLMPVLRAPAEAVLPRGLRSFQYIDATGLPASDVVHEIAAQLELQRAEQLEASLGVEDQMAVSARARHALELAALGHEQPPGFERLIARADAVLGSRHELTRRLLDAAGLGSVEELAPAEPDSADSAESAESAAESSRGVRSAEGARLIALNMALNGTPRDETARYLAQNFDLDDQDSLLDEVYTRVRG